MNSQEWEEIEYFYSLNEYERFLNWLCRQIENGSCEEINSVDENKIFKNIYTEEKWVLMIPDPGYFPGSWKKL